MPPNSTNSIVIFEWLTGGGLWMERQPFDCDSPVFRQGWAMLCGVVKDFKLASFDVSVLLDSRCPRIPDDVQIRQVASDDQLRCELKRAARRSGHVLAIAPETGQAMLRCCQWLRPWQQRCIFPDERFVRLCGNKNLVSRRLDAAGVPVAGGWPLDVWLADPVARKVDFPAVLKPIDGCGSGGVQFVASRNRLQIPERSANWRLESFVEGLSASVSVIAGRKPVFLPPVRQCFDGVPFGTYVDAANDLTPEQSLLARQLAKRVAAALPATRGYFGIDLVIAADRAVAIEVNPRLTVSYCRLREFCDFNLASAMVNAEVVSRNAI